MAIQDLTPLVDTIPAAMELRRALDEAVSAARAAGELLRADFYLPTGPRGHVDKADADTEAEHLIRVRLLQAFPDWGFLGEETGAQTGQPGAPIWLVDPNDGTRDYLKGRRGSTVAIGLVHEGRPVLGVVYAFGYPDDSGRMYAWAQGCGPITCDGQALDVHLPEQLGPHEVVLVSSGGDLLPTGNLECTAPARYRAVPSIAHRLALVAAGEASAATSLYAPCAWDLAAGHALVRGAGGVLVDERGSEIDYGPDGWCKLRCVFAGSAVVARMLASRSWQGLPDRPPEALKPAKLRRGQAIADPALLARAQGCLLGQVAGDSLGSLVEFEDAARIAAHFPDGPRELADGGTWNTLAGQPTDDSEMALALARAIVGAGRYESGAALAAYRAWKSSGPFDIGQTTRAALEGHPQPESQANGSLMRVSPLAVFAHALPADDVADLARRDAALTHPHPVCGDATGAYAVAVAHAVQRGDGAEAAYEAALGWARSAGAQTTVVQALERARQEAPACDALSQGFVLIALQNAFYELLHAPSLEAGVVRTVRRGGDTDTNAAIAGALLGAVHGREAVPAQWRRMLLSCRAHPSRSAYPRPWTCWPTDALELAERLLLAGLEERARLPAI
jgi:ADP-ribosylglycohydrolase/fructose-1,6-bisphosphatase/inositol monophosphatase family enzyme